MLQSKLFTKTKREAPKDEVSSNATLLIRAGFIDKLQAGVYTYLPLGLRVLKNIEQIIREEVNKVGGQEVLMPSLHPKEIWQKTGRWDSLDDLYKVIDKSGKESALGPTHEEVVVPLVKNFVSSYKDLPFSVYQFQNKFRMELRAKSGILRGREFIMKDMYSFHTNEEDLKKFYTKMMAVYKKIFSRLGIGKFTYVTFASGGSFSKYSHEFQTLTPAGEDTIYVCDKCKMAINKEIKAEQETCPDCGGKKFKEEKSIEVGNIFELKTKYSNPFDLIFKDKNGNNQIVVMGCYGIGLGRAMGAVVEAMKDDAGLVWPEAIAPYKFHLIELGGEKIHKKAVGIYKSMNDQGIEMLFDDRDVSPGKKFADADLIGLPYRIVVSEKNVSENRVELKNRKTGKTKMVAVNDLLKI